MTKFLIAVAHPDDETLGCGGSIAKWSSEGHEIRCVFVSDGESARVQNSEINSNTTKASIAKRKDMAKTALEILGVSDLIFFGLKDNRLDSYELLDIAKRLEVVVQNFAPDVVVTQSGSDLNLDHQTVHRAVITACRPKISSPVKKLLFFETPSSTEWNFSYETNSFKPNYFVDVSNTITSKLSALKEYGTEIPDFLHPRSLGAVEALAKYRGATVGMDFAEAFQVGLFREGLH